MMVCGLNIECNKCKRTTDAEQWRWRGGTGQLPSSPNSNSPGKESDPPLACVLGITNQLVGYCNKVGSNYNRSPKNMLGTIPGRSVSAVIKEKKQPQCGPGIPAELQTTCKPCPGFSPKSLAAVAGHHSSLPQACRPVSRGPLHGDGSPGSATRTSAFAFSSPLPG